MIWAGYWGALVAVDVGSGTRPHGMLKDVKVFSVSTGWQLDTTRAKAP